MGKSTFGIPLEGFGTACRNAGAEGAVLLKNDGDMLPLKKDETVSVFGRCLIETYRSGTGSGGAVNVPYSISLLEGLRKNIGIRLNEELVAVYENWLKENPFDNGGGGWAAEPWHQKEMPLTDEIVKTAREKSEKAVFIIGRTAGEDKDYENAEGSFLLTAQEKDNLKILTAYFEQVAVLLNVSNIIDMSWLEDSVYQNHIKAVLYTWQGGMEGGNAVADVLSGQKSPSGKLSDTIAYKLSDYPAHENFGSETQNIYAEDIYVGYRYFETFCPEKVQFPFGFGLSYAQFAIEITDAKVNGNGAEAIVEIGANITNTGKHSGKEVVQVYVEAPQGELGKPARELCAFAKTRELLPQESESIVFYIPVKRLASYDDSGKTGHKSCYVLEAGEYRFHVGNSVRNTVVADVNGEGALRIGKTVVTEELQEALAPVQGFERLKPGMKLENGTYERQEEAVPLSTVDMRTRIEAHLPKAIEQTGDKGIRLQDVAAGKESLEAFIAQLNNRELAMLVRGEGMSSPWVTPGTASAFGGLGDALHKYGIPIACAADGPSGIRMESGLKATQLPIGTLLACSFNVPMMEELYTMEGQELLSNEVDTLLGPGINIHRYPLNGRNFEYYSEDPYLTGKMAAAAAGGIAKSGSAATIKHFAANSQEKSRFKVDAVVSERAMREIYLKAFEMAVREGGATSVMTSYNPINGHWAASNYDLNTTILRGEWGYRGMVMTDWWASMNDVVEGGEESRQLTSAMVRAQNDLYMVVNNNGAEINAMGDDTEEALANGKLTVGEVQRCAMNICRFLLNAPVMKRPLKPLNDVRNIQPLAENAIPENAVETVYLAQTDRFTPKMGETCRIQVEKDGEYDLVICLSSAASYLAQATANLCMNGEVLAVIQTGETRGLWMTQKLMRLSLKKGTYTFQSNEVKPPIEIRWIRISAVENV